MRINSYQFINKTITIAFGVLVVVFLFSSPFHEINQKTKKQHKTEQSTNQDESDGDFLVISSDWVGSFSSIHIEPLLQWIRDIDFLENPVTHIFEIIETGTTQFFQTLFQRIISPNAP